MNNKDKKEQEILISICNNVDLKRVLDSLNIRMFFSNERLYVTKNNDQTECSSYGKKPGTIDMISAKNEDFNMIINVIKRKSGYTYSSIMFIDRKTNKRRLIENNNEAPENALSSTLKKVFGNKKGRQ